MRNARWWLLVVVLVAVAAFLSGVVRGVTGTAPFDVDADRQELRSSGAYYLRLIGSGLLR